MWGIPRFYIKPTYEWPYLKERFMKYWKGLIRITYNDKSNSIIPPRKRKLRKVKHINKNKLHKLKKKNYE